MGIEPTRVRFDSVAGFAHVWCPPVKMVWYSDPKAYREFSNDQWYQNYCGYNQKQHPSGSAWSFQHSSTYLNIFQLWFTFPSFPSHMCSPFPQVPTGCRLRVGREWRTWQPGKCLVFDDSYEHEERAYSGWPWRTNEIMRGKSWEK